MIKVYFPIAKHEPSSGLRWQEIRRLLSFHAGILIPSPSHSIYVPDPVLVTSHTLFQIFTTGPQGSPFYRLES